MRLISATELGSFSWRWPEETEHFERGYEALVQFDGREFGIRHGIGRRTVSVALAGMAVVRRTRA